MRTQRTTKEIKKSVLLTPIDTILLRNVPNCENKIDKESESPSP